VKMGYYNIAGQFKRERMLRFSRERLEKTEEPGFVELCSSRKSNMARADVARFSKENTNREDSN